MIYGAKISVKNLWWYGGTGGWTLVFVGNDNINVGGAGIYTVEQGYTSGVWDKMAKKGIK